MNFTAEDKKNCVTRYHRMMREARAMKIKGMTPEQISKKMVDDWTAEIKAELAAIVERN